jgi:Mn-dependent DtxR family transcriptional regulator
MVAKIRFQNLYQAMLLLSSYDVKENKYNLTKLHHKLILSSNTSNMTGSLFSKIMVELEKKEIIKTTLKGRERLVSFIDKKRVNSFLEAFSEYKDITE